MDDNLKILRYVLGLELIMSISFYLSVHIFFWDFITKEKNKTVIVDETKKCFTHIKQLYVYEKLKT